jgi:hypothetical protein
LSYGHSFGPKASTRGQNRTGIPRFVGPVLEPIRATRAWRAPCRDRTGRGLLIRQAPPTRWTTAHVRRSFRSQAGSSMCFGGQIRTAMTELTAPRPAVERRRNGRACGARTRFAGVKARQPTHSRTRVACPETDEARGNGRTSPPRSAAERTRTPSVLGKSQEPVQSGADGKLPPAQDSNLDDPPRKRVLYPLS